ncbi:MAG: GxxExxY protein [Bacteroidaceae bacterium]|nr:GxxExxY protein [Bacteroidaceae bacterium]
MELLFEEETKKIISACYEVHRVLGRGFTEPVYQLALAEELRLQDIPFGREEYIPFYYKGKAFNNVFRPDFICFSHIIVELKAVSALLPEHEAQLINYLKAADYPVGLLVNFGTDTVQVKRRVNLY